MEKYQYNKPISKPVPSDWQQSSRDPTSNIQVQCHDETCLRKQNKQTVPTFFFFWWENWIFAPTKVTYPDAKEKPLLTLCSTELAGATETSVLDG